MVEIEPTPRESVDNWPMARTIHTVSGGLPSTSTSGSQPKESQSKQPRTEDVIVFTDDDLQHVQVFHADPVVILLTIANYDVKRIMVDNGSSTDVLYYDTFLKVSLSTAQLQPISFSLVEFIGTSVPVEGTITLPVTTDIEPHQRTLRLTFLVVKVPSAYNAILGCLGLNAF